MKDRCSITIDSKVSESVLKQAEKENRTFSNMIELMAKNYLDSLKKNK